MFLFFSLFASCFTRNNRNCCHFGSLFICRCLAFRRIAIMLVHTRLFVENRLT